jgi:hypothetical protein
MVLVAALHAYLPLYNNILRTCPEKLHKALPVFALCNGCANVLAAS